MLQNFWSDTLGQTVHNQIRLPLEMQCDQGLHCLQFKLYFHDTFHFGKISLNFDKSKFLLCPKNLANYERGSGDFENNQAVDKINKIVSLFLRMKIC